jgi:chaperonin GroEL
VQASPSGWGFDVVEGQYVDMMSANIIDPLPTVRTAFTHGVSAASMALTTNALVYRSDKDETPSFEP